MEARENEIVMPRIDEGQVALYLLGSLPEQGAARLEEQVAGSEECLEIFQAVEDDLIRRYAAGELRSPERRRFEEHYLTTATRRERVGLALALAQLARDKAAPPAAASGWKLIACAAIAFAVACAAFFVVGVEPPVARTSAHLSLSPGQTRGEQAEPVVKLVDDLGSVTAELRLERSGDYSAYRVVLRKPGGPVLWSGAATAGPDAARVDIPVKAIGPGGYQMTLQAPTTGGAYQDVDDYFFSVER